MTVRANIYGVEGNDTTLISYTESDTELFKIQEFDYPNVCDTTVDTKDLYIHSTEIGFILY